MQKSKRINILSFFLPHVNRGEKHLKMNKLIGNYYNLIQIIFCARKQWKHSGKLLKGFCPMWWHCQCVSPWGKVAQHLSPLLFTTYTSYIQSWGAVAVRSGGLEPTGVRCAAVKHDSWKQFVIPEWYHCRVQGVCVCVCVQEKYLYMDASLPQK